MPDFLKIEHALIQVTKEPDKYIQSASYFQSILVSENTTPKEKALQIAELIREGMK